MQEKVSQADVVTNLVAQAEGQGVDLSHADLSGISWSELDISGATIAMSLFRGASFAAPQALNGCTWIGNRLEECRFESVDMAKAELLDCAFEGCTLQSPRLFRTDLSGTVFSSCRLVDVDFSQAAMIRTRFNRCSFVNVRLAGDLLVSGNGDFAFGPDGDPISSPPAAWTVDNDDPQA
ncbi:pentapeptide repeat-containing protein [Variovorax sp. R-27]|uniref:pentapeptide repeat-containing protein n=1 Tax=Variovorax sp. R-27 TaxID=3404058 RepID=UPI003CE86446